MKIGFACDHAGFELKEQLKEALIQLGYTITDFGTYSKESVDYPDFAHKLGVAVDTNEVDFGIAICYTGNGINITMNKHQTVRAALCWTTQIATLARQHNNANVCSLPAHFISFDEALTIVKVFLSEAFEGGRHQCRIDKISCS